MILLNFSTSPLAFSYIPFDSGIIDPEITPFFQFFLAYHNKTWNLLLFKTFSPNSMVSKILSFFKMTLVWHRVILAADISIKNEYIYSSLLLAIRKKYTPNRTVHNAPNKIPHACFTLNFLFLICCWFGAKPIITIFFWNIWRIFISEIFFDCSLAQTNADSSFS